MEEITFILHAFIVNLKRVVAANKEGGKSQTGRKSCKSPNMNRSVSGNGRKRERDAQIKCV